MAKHEMTQVTTGADSYPEAQGTVDLLLAALS